MKALSPEQAQQLIQSGECDVVDVREAREWSQATEILARFLAPGDAR